MLLRIYVTVVEKFIEHNPSPVSSGISPSCPQHTHTQLNETWYVHVTSLHSDGEVVPTPWHKTSVWRKAS